MIQRTYRITQNERMDGSVFYRVEWNSKDSPEWQSVFSTPDLETARSVRKEREAKQLSGGVVKQVVIE